MYSAHAGIKPHRGGVEPATVHAAARQEGSVLLRPSLAPMRSVACRTGRVAIGRRRRFGRPHSGWSHHSATNRSHPSTFPASPRPRAGCSSTAAIPGLRREEAADRRGPRSGVRVWRRGLTAAGRPGAGEGRASFRRCPSRREVTGPERLPAAGRVARVPWPVRRPLGRARARRFGPRGPPQRSWLCRGNSDVGARHRRRGSRWSAGSCWQARVFDHL